MLSINGYSPYSAVYGRVPQILPGINQIDLPLSTEPHNRPGMIANTHRLREIAIEAIVSASAKARLNYAMQQRRTTPAGEELKLEINDLVDFYRPPTTKSESGWWGPARVTDLSQITCGTISLRFAARQMMARVADVRRHLAYHCIGFCGLTSEYLRTSPMTAWRYAQAHINEMGAGKILSLIHI